MKNSKIIIAAFTIIFAVLVSNANESAEKQQIIIQTEFVTPNCQGIPIDSEKITCTNHALPTVSDIKIREDYNTLHEEEDALFEFDTLNYLPSDFNAYSEDESILAALELLNEEEDAPFEFNTNKYIQLGFNSNCQYELSEIFEVEIEEEDASFDFDTKMYLPENFNPYSNTNIIGALAQL
jgi:hypothetical protein